MTIATENHTPVRPNSAVITEEMIVAIIFFRSTADFLAARSNHKTGIARPVLHPREEPQEKIVQSCIKNAGGRDLHQSILNKSWLQWQLDVNAVN